MLNDWTHWFLSMPYDLLLKIMLPMLLFNGVRYVLATLLMFLYDVGDDLYRYFWPERELERYAYCPSICVVVAGLNEEDTIFHTLKSVWGTYPRLQIIIVDDGSHDGMAREGQKFAENHSGVLVLRKPQRGGKSSALNFALSHIDAEIVVCVDGDSHLHDRALWEIVQPLADPEIGAVSGCVLARNPFSRLVTWLQSFEYLQTILLGRMLSSRLGMLGIISGAFGAYRLEALTRVQGWDVGPGEDGDLTLRIRKASYRVAFQPNAQCFTNVPESWIRLVNQRRRWEWAVVTFECRKHIDMANPLSSNFRYRDLFLMIERWTFNIVLNYLSWIYVIWLALHWHENVWKIYFLYYLVLALLQCVQVGTILYYSNNRTRDLKIGLAAPLTPFYYALLRLVTMWSVTEEFLSRRSFRDDFVPKHVREATWHW